MAILGTALAVEKAPGQEVESWAFGKGYRKGRDWGGLRNPFGESACPRAMALFAFVCTTLCPVGLCCLANPVASCDSSLVQSLPSTILEAGRPACDLERTGGVASKRRLSLPKSWLPANAFVVPADT